jgi:hypothetical protein
LVRRRAFEGDLTDWTRGKVMNFPAGDAVREGVGSAHLAEILGT